MDTLYGQTVINLHSVLLCHFLESFISQKRRCGGQTMNQDCSYATTSPRVAAELILHCRFAANNRNTSSGVRIPAGTGHFSLHHRVQTGSGANPASHPVGTRGFFPGVKRPVLEADHFHLLPRSRMRGAIPPLPQ
jgi:hypothetical protein